MIFGSLRWQRESLRWQNEMAAGVYSYDPRDWGRHAHCQTCHNGRNCEWGGKGNVCEVIDCQNACGHRFHACKLEEHLGLCQLELSRCLNVAYGCDEMLPRWKLASHLQICPASVVVCPLVWNRQKGPQQDDWKYLKTAGDQRPSYSAAAEELDVILALRDQMAIQTAFAIPQAIRGHLKGDILPPLPLLIPWHKVDGKWLSGLIGGEKEIVQADEEKFVEEEEEKPVESAISRDCIICRTDPSSQHLHVLGSLFASGIQSPIFEGIKAPSPVASKPKGKVGPNVNKFYEQRQLHVDVTAEFLSLGNTGLTERKKKFFTLCCDQLLRRDQFADHCWDVHVMIISGLNGHLVERCPMHLYGCEQLQSRFTPDSGQLVFNDFSDCFTVVNRPVDQMLTGNEAELPSLLDRLPYELLHRVAEFLDSVSLYCLSATSKQLRNLCRTFLPSAGVTELTWVKTVDAEGKVRWVQGKQRWIFPKCFHRVRRWNFHLSTLGCHVTKCQEYSPIAHEERVRVMFAPSS